MGQASHVQICGEATAAGLNFSWQRPGTFQLACAFSVGSISVDIKHRILQRCEDVQMNNLLPQLHEGHAPITLHQLFREALEAYDDWVEGADAPAVYYQGMPFLIGHVFDHMRNCTDILPNNMVSAITERLRKPWSSDSPLDEMTFSTAARVMSILTRKRELRRSGSDINAFIRRFEKRRSDRVQH
jgi:hypothetical protein